MSEDRLVFHCAPTLAGMKSGSLFASSYSDKAELVSEMRSLNRRLSHKGLWVLPLRYSEGRALVYVCRPRCLARDLGSGEARKILSEVGYDSFCPARSLTVLARRLEKGEAFPHEIGLFLGYPPEDVRGFMEKGGRDCKCVGTWKVYGDEEKARRTFSRYKHCTNVYCRLYNSCQRTLEQLAVSS